MCVCACVRSCMRVCVRSCVRACAHACVRACMRVHSVKGVHVASSLVFCPMQCTFQDDHFLYYVFNYIPGGSLHFHLVRGECGQGREGRGVRRGGRGEGGERREGGRGSWRGWGGQRRRMEEADERRKNVL